MPHPSSSKTTNIVKTVWKAYNPAFWQHSNITRITFFEPNAEEATPFNSVCIYFIEKVNMWKNKILAWHSPSSCAHRHATCVTLYATKNPNQCVLEVLPFDVAVDGIQHPSYQVRLRVSFGAPHPRWLFKKKMKLICDRFFFRHKISFCLYQISEGDAMSCRKGREWNNLDCGWC